MTDGDSDDILSGHGAALRGLQIEIRVCVGHARSRLGEMLAMQPEAVLPLDSRVEDKVALYVGERIIATGELVELDGPDAGRLAVRVTTVGGRGDDAE